MVIIVHITELFHIRLHPLEGTVRRNEYLLFNRIEHTIIVIDLKPHFPFMTPPVHISIDEKQYVFCLVHIEDFNTM